MSERWRDRSPGAPQASWDRNHAGNVVSVVPTDLQGDQRSQGTPTRKSAIFMKNDHYTMKSYTGIQAALDLRSGLVCGTVSQPGEFKNILG